MPKMKKPPHNAYYYFMLDRKAELERLGNRFPGGMKDVAEAVRDEWRDLPQEEKDYYTNRAKESKEKEKFNLHNKFTVTGESYAQVHAREAAEKAEKEKLERYIDDLTITSQTPPENRNFIFIKTIHSCLQHNENIYWPLELAIGVFNLKDGLKCNYHTLIDTKISPFGFASTVKETQEETALPVPGSPLFGPNHSDYKKILKNFRKFIEKYLEEYPRGFVLFAMDNELKSAEGCVKWLYQEAELDEIEVPAWENFLRNLKFYQLPRLVLRLAVLAKARNPEYNHVMVVFQDLDQAAVSLLNEGCFDYRDDITCPFHRQEDNSYKMNLCCRNVVLRRIYLLLNHMVPAMKLQRKDGHDIEKFVLKASSCRPLLTGEKRPKAPKQEVKHEQEEKKVRAAVEPQECKPLPPVIPVGQPRAQPVSDDDEDEITAGFLVTAPAPTTDPQIPFGLIPESAPANFQEDDFPALSSAMSSSKIDPIMGWGVGIGRGRGKREHEPDDDFPPLASAIGRGRGGL